MTLTPEQDGLLKLDGELGFATVEEIWDALLQQEQKQVKLDLSKVHRIDSAGVATLVAFMAHAKEQGIEVKMTGASSQLLSMARVSGVDTMLPLSWK